MSTINQRLRLHTWVWYQKYARPKFGKAPHKKGVVLRLRICTPRKPNSARRAAVKLLLSTKKKALGRIMGTGHNLRRHSRTLLMGGGARDVPVVNYTCIPGVYDFGPLFNQKHRRSIYGIPKPAELRTHIRRKLRNKV